MSEFQSFGKSHRWIQAHVNYDGDWCLIWPFGGANGYGTFGGWVDGKKVFVYAHRYMCELVHGPAPSSDHEASHSCGRGHEGCVHPRHVSWKTKSENQADRARHGTKSTGCRGKLTPEQAAEIMSLRGRMPQKDIAARFGISRANVSLIHCGKLWTPDKKRRWPGEAARDTP